MAEMMDFCGFPKIARLSREVIVTEKIDGTNAQVYIGADGTILAGSRTRWITPDDDNFGFAAWVAGHREELLTLGPGRHFGEWWGRGIQRHYGAPDRRWSLFNTVRWALPGSDPQPIPTGDPRVVKMQDVLPPCCSLVPVLWRGNFDDLNVTSLMVELAATGSRAWLGFPKPEGIVLFHVAGGVAFKKTLDRDDEPKGRARG